MTPSAQTDRLAADSTRGILGELTSALIAADRRALEVCCSRLEELAPRLLQERAALAARGDEAWTQLADLRSGLRFARTLSLRAARFYDGWARVAALQGSAYTRGGQQAVTPTARSMALEA